MSPLNQPLEESQYQLDYAASHAEAHDPEGRRQKARKTLAVLREHLKGLSRLSALEIGCSTGFLSQVYSSEFRTMCGIDIDEKAIEFANRENTSSNLSFFVRDGMNTGFPDDSFDVVLCSHVYEHVPNSDTLMNEIYRILRPGGVCYFAAGNRIIWRDPDNYLVMLSLLPRWAAHLYMRAAGKGRYYHERLRTVFGLRKLVRRFELHDYTLPIIENPARFEATDILTPGSFKQKLALIVASLCYWVFPTYIWVLKKH